MNDNDIIKALECCAFEHDCKGCFYNVPESAYSVQCIEKIMRASLDLINRQKAEIEKYEKEHNENFKKWMVLDEKTKKRYAELYEEAKGVVRAEEIREFAEKLKKRVMKYTEYDEGGWDSTIYAVKVEDINSLVKEMTEGHHAEND